MNRRFLRLVEKRTEQRMKADEKKETNIYIIRLWDDRKKRKLSLSFY